MTDALSKCLARVSRSCSLELARDVPGVEIQPISPINGD